MLEHGASGPWAKDAIWIVVEDVELTAADAGDMTGADKKKVNGDLTEIGKQVSALATVIRKRFGFDEK